MNDNRSTAITGKTPSPEKSICVRVPATSANLGAGYDCLGLSLELYSEFKLRLRHRPGLNFVLQGEGTETVCQDERNIVWQAVKFLLKRAGAQDEFLGANIGLRNNIPLSRGLGSSAAAIVGGLKAANVILGNRYNRREILQMATEIEGHPDNVAPAVFGGVTVNLMERGQVRTMSFVPKLRLKMVTAIPNFHLSTQQARQVLPENVSLKDAVFNIGHAAMLVAALSRADERMLKYAFDDTLHQPYRAHLIPGFWEVITAARENGALGATLSGAGPTVIAFTTEHSHNAAQIAAAMKNAFAANDVKAKTMILGLDAKGAHIFGNRKESC